jgi:ATP-dependent helicase/nuclease subunit A
MKNNIQQTEQDAHAREQALDPQQSFIVQAPAGSGKTELLVRRYLVLLTRVRTPESIIAITFTRKAAAEMRLRIIQSLETAEDTCCAEKEKGRWALAKKVLAHDKAMKWNLLANPNRLRIQTIDSFCQTLTRQMPLLSTLADTLTPIENPEFLYRLAVQELISSLEHASPWQASLIHLVKHLDNDFNHLENLLSELLSSREQWLNYLVNSPARDDLEKSLHAINQTLVTQLNQLTPTDLRQELTELLNFSLHQREEKVLTQSGDLHFWKNALVLLLTQDGEWRKEVTKNQGFPSPSDKKNKPKKAHYTAIKQRAIVLIQQLKNQPGLHALLIDLKNAPPLSYNESQWTTLNALFTLLPLLVAHLKLVFQQQQKVDYTEILLCALAALSDENKPTDLALNLDYQIEHLLVDEFQDTSISQFQLIEKLTAGWQIDDGRTLFLVGDPMQSIYRFRKAEVGLFLQVQQQGIGDIHLHALSLSVNFRSHPSIIEWINRCFSQLLPRTENINRGAINFSPAIPFHQHKSGNTIKPFWFNESDPMAEAHKIVEIIQKIKQENPQDSIALLVRARTHLLTLLPIFNQASIPYHAIEIESLAEKSAIQDILALTRALHHLGDRISWLALLRSPFCGLDLRDLHEISQFTDPTYPVVTIWQQLTWFERIPLREDTKQRCRRIVPILQQGLQEQGRLPLNAWIKKTWLALGGPTTLTNPEDIVHIQTYLNFLEKKVLTEGNQLDLFKLAEELTKLVTQNNTKPTGAVEIMTIHKAKGLEYDHIILPSLHRKGSSDRSKLLHYQEQLLTQQNKTFLIAPIKASHETEDAIYNYLAREEKQKSRYELTRLLYVATTRAKKSLSLLAIVTENNKEETKTTPSDSLLYYLWPVLTPKEQELAFSTFVADKHSDQIPGPRWLKRLPCDWKNLSLNNPTLEAATTHSQFSHQWTLNTAQLTGTAIHRLLYQISQDGLAYWDTIDFDKENKRFIRLLEQTGIVASQLDNALTILQKSLKKILQDPQGRWILSQQHKEAHSEFALTVIQNGKLQNLIIDRTFIDHTGVRWIIDYKTTPYQGDDPTSFLNAAMQQHKEQLETYAAALAQRSTLKENNTMRLALYFPLNSLWHEWEYTPIVFETAF